MNFFVCLYILLIVILHLLPTGGYSFNTTKFGPFRADYLLHSVVFLPWMFLLLLRHKTNKPVRFQSGLIWMMLGLIMALVAEGIHYWLPYRSFNPMDGLFNALGVVAGAVLVLGWQGIRKLIS